MSAATTPREESRSSRVARAAASRRTPSTRVRILGWYMVLLAVAIGFGLFLQRSILLAQIDSEVDAQLRQEVQELEQLSQGRNPRTGQAFGTDVRAIFTTFLERNVPVEGEALFTLVDGRPYAATIAPAPLFDDPDVVAKWAAVATPAEGEIDSDAGPVRYLAMPLRDGDRTLGTFVVTVFLDERRENVSEALRVGAVVYGSTFLVVSALAWFAAGRILRPITELTDAARSISDANWTRRIPVRGDDQIAELARTFNDMLDRLEESFTTQKRFINDAGHELRTPITIIRGHLEVMGDDPADREETMLLVLDELGRMSRMVDDLLLLARAEQPDFLHLQPIDIAELIEEVVAKASPLADRRWGIEKEARIVMLADRQRLTQVLTNLARNAVQHTAPDSPITFGSEAEGNAVRIWIRDHGEGIPLAEQEHIFERFARGQSGRRRSEGAGLGLAIVKAIVEAHGGRILLDSIPGEGTMFTMIMPVDGRPKESP